MSTALDAATEQRVLALLQARIAGLQAVYVFGSAAGPDWRTDSDVDIAVLATRPLDGLSRFEIAQAVAEIVARDVDLIDLWEASSVLRVQVVANGQRLYAAPDAPVAEFEDFVFSDYARLNEERAGILADIAERGRVHGG